MKGNNATELLSVSFSIFGSFDCYLIHLSITFFPLLARRNHVGVSVTWLLMSRFYFPPNILKYKRFAFRFYAWWSETWGCIDLRIIDILLEKNVLELSIAFDTGDTSISSDVMTAVANGSSISIYDESNELNKRQSILKDNIFKHLCSTAVRLIK